MRRCRCSLLISAPAPLSPEEEALPEEDENEENPFAMEFQEDQEAAYLKDPKKALQGFFDREGETCSATMWPGLHSQRLADHLQLSDHG